MNDYKELVEELRDKYNEDRCKRLTLEAADAIENLERKVENLEQENRFLKSIQKGIAENMEPDSLGKMVARAMREVRYE